MYRRVHYFKWPLVTPTDLCAPLTPGTAAGRRGVPPGLAACCCRRCSGTSSGRTCRPWPASSWPCSPERSASASWSTPRGTEDTREAEGGQRGGGGASHNLGVENTLLKKVWVGKNDAHFKKRVGKIYIYIYPFIFNIDSLHVNSELLWRGKNNIK